VARRFEGYHWHVIDIGDRANDLDAMAGALGAARAETGRPSLVILRSHIGYGSPNMQDTSEVHGQPLGEEEVRLTKESYGWPAEAQFHVPEEVLQHMRRAQERGDQLEAQWRRLLDRYRDEYPDLAARLEAALRQDLPEGWDDDLPRFAPADGPMATREAGGKVLNAIAPKVPYLVGGSGDLAPSTRTLIEGSEYFEKDNYAGRNIAYGVREHAMCALSCGLALHGGVRPYASTFFVFSDYARPAIRLAALMELPVVYVMTHDSIAVGEDGPTHQPVAHLASFRAMPNVCVIRPADANETAVAWRAAMIRRGGPTMLVLSRQKLPILDQEGLAPAEGLLRGAYVLSGEPGGAPEVILMASGSEVPLALEAQRALAEAGVDARVVSFPSWELFREQPRRYRDEVLPPRVKARIAIEAAAPQGWCEWLGEAGEAIGMATFGASAPGGENFEQYGFTVENIVLRARKLVGAG